MLVSDAILDYSTDLCNLREDKTANEDLAMSRMALWRAFLFGRGFERERQWRSAARSPATKEAGLPKARSNPSAPAKVDSMY